MLDKEKGVRKDVTSFDSVVMVNQSRVVKTGTLFLVEDVKHVITDSVIVIIIVPEEDWFPVMAKTTS